MWRRRTVRIALATSGLGAAETARHRRTCSWRRMWPSWVEMAVNDAFAGLDDQRGQEGTARTRRQRCSETVEMMRPWSRARCTPAAGPTCRDRTRSDRAACAAAPRSTAAEDSSEHVAGSSVTARSAAVAEGYAPRRANAGSRGLSRGAVSATYAARWSRSRLTRRSRARSRRCPSSSAASAASPPSREPFAASPRRRSATSRRSPRRAPAASRGRLPRTWAQSW